MLWDPTLYDGYADHRQRPAFDLLARVLPPAPRLVYDLGCGTGAASRLLALRWPTAEVTGIDSSAEMLDQARRTSPAAIHWLRADIDRWHPDRAPDVIFSNAALHWLGDHPRLFRRLMGALPSSGVLAVQMPRNHEAPTHTAITDLAAESRWAARLMPLLRPSPVAPAQVYYDILSPLARTVDVWETEYLHVLTGEAPVVRWTSSTVLAPFVQALEEPDRQAFVNAYAARMAAAYPRRADGTTLMPFRRLFMVASKP